MVIKLTGRTQADIDAEAAAEEQERQIAEAWQKLRERQAVMSRLVLWLMRYVWPRLTTEEKAEVRGIIPEDMEDDVRAALERLP